MLRNPGVGVINGGLGAVLYALLAVMMMITTRSSSSIIRESMTRTNSQGSLEGGEWEEAQVKGGDALVPPKPPNPPPPARHHLLTQGEPKTH